jgi:hypothetical protein
MSIWLATTATEATSASESEELCAKEAIAEQMIALMVNPVKNFFFILFLFHE